MDGYDLSRRVFVTCELMILTLGCLLLFFFSLFCFVSFSNRFYAPWCKSCKKLDLHFHKLAAERGDAIVARQKVLGPVRFVQIPLTQITKSFIESLKVVGLPTMQLYHRTHKLWEGAGHLNTKQLKEELVALQSLSKAELTALAIERDDGVIEEAIEDSFYSYSFLDEEW